MEIVRGFEDLARVRRVKVVTGERAELRTECLAAVDDGAEEHLADRRHRHRNPVRVQVLQADEEAATDAATEAAANAHAEAHLLLLRGRVGDEAEEAATAARSRRRTGLVVVARTAAARGASVRHGTSSMAEIGGGAISGYFFLWTPEGLEVPQLMSGYMALYPNKITRLIANSYHPAFAPESSQRSNACKKLCPTDSTFVSLTLTR